MSTLVTQHDSQRLSMAGTLPNHLTRSFRLTSGPVRPEWFRPQDTIVQVKNQLLCAAPGSFIITLDSKLTATTPSILDSNYSLFYVDSNGFVQIEHIVQDEHGVHVSKTGKRFRDLAALVRFYSSLDTEDAAVNEFLDVRLTLPMGGNRGVANSGLHANNQWPEPEYNVSTGTAHDDSMGDRDVQNADIDDATLRDVSNVILTWTTRDVAVWLSAVQLQHLASFLPTVDGRKLLTLTDDDLSELGITDDADIQLVLKARHELLGARRRRTRKNKTGAKSTHARQPTPADDDAGRAAVASTPDVFDPLSMSWHDRLPKPNAKLTAPRVRRKFAVRQNVRDGRMVVQDVATGEVIHKLSPALAARITSIKKPLNGAGSEVEAERNLLLKLMGMKTNDGGYETPPHSNGSTRSNGLWDPNDRTDDHTHHVSAGTTTPGYDRFAPPYHHHLATHPQEHHTGLTADLQHSMVQLMHQGKADLPVLNEGTPAVANDNVSVAESEDVNSDTASESSRHQGHAVRQYVVPGWNPDFQRATGAGLSHGVSLLPSVLHSVSKAYQQSIEDAGDEDWYNALATFARSGEGTSPPPLSVRSRDTQRPEEGKLTPVDVVGSAKDDVHSVARLPSVTSQGKAPLPPQDPRTHPNRISMKSVQSSELDETRANDDLFYEDFLESALNASEPGNLRLYSPRQAPPSPFQHTGSQPHVDSNATLHTGSTNAARDTQSNPRVAPLFDKNAPGNMHASHPHQNGNVGTGVTLTFLAPRDVDPTNALVGAQDGEYLVQPQQLSVVYNDRVFTQPLVHDATRGRVRLANATVAFPGMAGLIAYYQEPRFMDIATSEGRHPELPVPLARVREQTV